MDYNQTQLKKALAKMLPEQLRFDTNFVYPDGTVYWLYGGCVVQNTEWLYICHFIEKELSLDLHKKFREQLCVECLMDGGPISASWEQRASSLTKISQVTTPPIEIGSPLLTRIMEV